MWCTISFQIWGRDNVIHGGFGVIEIGRGASTHLVCRQLSQRHSFILDMARVLPRAGAQHSKSKHISVSTKHVIETVKPVAKVQSCAGTRLRTTLKAQYTSCVNSLLRSHHKPFSITSSSFTEYHSVQCWVFLDLQLSPTWFFRFTKHSLLIVSAESASKLYRNWPPRVQSKRHDSSHYPWWPSFINNKLIRLCKDLVVHLGLQLRDQLHSCNCVYAKDSAEGSIHLRPITPIIPSSTSFSDISTNSTTNVAVFRVASSCSRQKTRHVSILSHGRQQKELSFHPFRLFRIPFRSIMIGQSPEKVLRGSRVCGQNNQRWRLTRASL